MKIALIGATGFVGSAVLDELSRREHLVTALLRDPSKLEPKRGVSTVAADAYDAAALAASVRGHDAVVSAFNPGWSEPALYDQFMRGSAAIERGVTASGVKRLLVVGGAGSLFVAPGVQLVDTPQFEHHVPANIVPGARAARDALSALPRQRRARLDVPEPSGAARCGRPHGHLPRGRRAAADGR